MTENKKETGISQQINWINEETQQITVPAVLANQLLKIARILDEGQSLEQFIRPRTVDLSGISIKYLKDGPAVYLKDLLKAGYKIRPISLVDKLRKDTDKEK